MGLLTNWYRTTNQPFFKVPVSILNVDPPEEIDFAILQTLCRVNNEKNAPSVPFEGKIYSISETPLIGTFFGKFIVSIEDCKTLTSKKHLHILSKFGPIICQYLGKINGFDKKEGNKSFGGQPMVNSTLQIYDGMLSQSRILPSGDVITSIDAAKRWMQTLEMYITSLMARGHSKERLFTELEDSTMRCPSYSKRRWFDAKLNGFPDMIAKNRIPGKNQTFIEFWNQPARRKFIAKYNLTIRPDTQIAEVRLKNGRSLYYPITIIRTKIDLSTVNVANKKIASSSQRLKLNNEISKKIFGAPLTFGKLIVQYSNKPLNGENLATLGYTNGVFSIPELLLGNDVKISISKSTDINYLLKNYGPWCGPKTLTLHYLTPPLDELIEFFDLKADELIQRLHNDLQSGAKAYGLGTFQQGDYVELKSGTPAEFSASARKLGKQIGESSIDIIVPILPETDNARCYALTKRALGDSRTKSKGIHWVNFSIIANQQVSRDRYSIRNLMALAIYSRALEAGEAGMLLANSARGLPNGISPMILATDISRDVQKKQEATADIITMNGKGLLLSTPTTYSFNEGVIQSRLIREWLVDRITFAVNKVSEIKLSSPNTLIFGYDGKLQRKQVDEFEKGIFLAIEELITEKILSQDVASVILEIIKRIPDRIYNENGTLPPEGTYLADSNDTGYLIGSYPYIGTSQPLRVRIALQTKKIFTARSAIQFIHDMRYLDFTSPYTQPREAIFMHVVDKKAKLARHGAVPYIPF